jgi:hypothetical protein
MTRLINLRKILTAALILGAIGIGSLSTARACDAPRYFWKTITTYTTVEKPVVESETRFDHCGRPFEVKVVSFVRVRVPVTQQVKVWY